MNVSSQELSTPPKCQLPDVLYKHFAEAREVYGRGAHAEALAIDQRLLAAAETAGHHLGRILGHRFVGLCLYRLGRLEGSERSFQSALELARKHKEVEQELLLCNHLAATVRRLGRLDDAYELLEAALRRATLPAFLHAHARLLGNLGALLDELGQRARADECYAKFEVLTELLGNAQRLANARGLAARSAELRRDFTTAAAKYEDEFRLAVSSNDVLRQIAAAFHRAQMADHLGRPDDADNLFRQAIELASARPYEKRLIDAHERYAAFLHKQGTTSPGSPSGHRALARAYYHLRAAERLCKRSDKPQLEKLANVAHALALVCRDAGLRGESLFHLMESVRMRAELYAPLQRVRELAQARFGELRGFTDELVAEALRVPRDADEERALEELVVRVQGEAAWQEHHKRIEASGGDPVWTWSRLVRGDSKALWRERLLAGVFDDLHEGTRKALVRAELSYHGAIDDLGRCTHLLALAVECELRQRVFIPAHRVCQGNHACRGPSETHNIFRNHNQKRSHDQWTLGQILRALTEVFDGSLPLAPNDHLHALRRFLAPALPLVRRVAELGQEIRPLRGGGLHLVDIRNEFAHALTTDPDRLQVDAIKRTLALETPADGEPTILEALAKIRLP